MRRLILALGVVACASPGLPPGGPEDRVAPELLQITPDTGALNAQPRSVVFQFDEVVSDRPQGAPSLERLFLVSPSDGEPRVSWHRRSIAVRPRGRFRPNTTYTVTLLPGLSDLRGNVRREGATAIFSTGPAIPGTQVSGIVFDWTTSAVARTPLVEAVSASDTTLVYVTLGDTLGRFTLRHLAPGRYVVRAVLDANTNRALDPRELWDSATVSLVDSARVELLAFVHDTIGPRINTVTVTDSMTLRVGFDKPLDPALPLGWQLFRLRSADSTIVPVAVARSGTQWDRETVERERARADSIRLADTTAARRPADTATVRRAARGAPRDTIPLPTPSRPRPDTEVVLVLQRPIVPGRTYRLTAVDVRNLLGRARTSDRVFTAPEPRAAPAPGDTAATRRTPRDAAPTPAGVPRPAGAPPPAGAPRPAGSPPPAGSQPTPP